LSDFNGTWIFSTDCRENIKYKVFSFKIRPVGAKLFHAERRTDGHEEAFRNSANAPKNETFYMLFG
jgi:hypothetical protein